MRVSMATTALVFAGALAVYGQGPKPIEHSMTGCLAKGGDEKTFKLTDVVRDAANVYNFGETKTLDILESTVDLAPHIGHKVTITGTKLPDKDFTAHKMKVTEVKMASTTCP